MGYFGTWFKPASRQRARKASAKPQLFDNEVTWGEKKTQPGLLRGGGGL